METWKRSSYCEGGHCVEVAIADGTIVVRSSIFPGTNILVSLREWEDFVAGVKAGEFDYSYQIP